jgi:hypothetical protein
VRLSQDPKKGLNLEFGRVLSVVQVEGGGKTGGFPARHLFFQDVKKTGGGFRIAGILEIRHYFVYNLIYIVSLV